MINYRDTLITKVFLFFYTKFIKKGEKMMNNTAISATKKNTQNITFPKK